MTLEVRQGWVHSNTLFAQQVDQEWIRLVVPVREPGLVLLVLLHALDVLVKEVCRIEWSALGFRVELSGEDGSGVVNETLIGLVVQVCEVLAPLRWKSRGVNSIAVVLRGDMALASGQVKSRNVVGTVSIFELDCLGACSESEELVTHADAHDGDLGGLEQLAEVVDGRLAMGWVTRSVGDEDTVEVVRNLVDGVVEGEAGDASSTRNKAAEDVLLDTAVDQSNVQVTKTGAHVEGGLRADPSDKVDGLGVDVSLILVGVILLSNRDTSKRRALLPEVCHNLTGVDAGNSWDTLPSTPFSKTFDSSPVAVPQRVVLDNNAGSLNVGRLEVSKEAVLVSSRRRDSIVANEGLCKDENLSTVGRIGHGLWVAYERCGEDCFTRDIGFGAERFPGEDWSILDVAVSDV